MIQRFKGKENIIKLGLFILSGIGLYFVVAWASYSPLDNGWSTANSLLSSSLNKTGYLGAWTMDLLFAMFGQTAFFIPFALTFTPIYLLIAGSESLQRNQVLLWLFSFVLFMLGITLLSDQLLSDSHYDLAGGFVGGLFSDWLEPVIGQIGVMIVAMLLVSVGFYFCSGQVILQLLTSLYYWVIGQQAEPKDVEQAVDSDKNFATMPEEQYELEIEQEPQQLEVPFTDVSQFTRPNIIGLKSTESLKTEAESPVDEAIAVHLLPQDSAVALPKVTVSEVQEPSISVTMDPLFTPSEVELAAQNHNNLMPKVSLVNSDEEDIEPAFEHQAFSRHPNEIALQEIKSKDVENKAKTPVVHPLLKRATPTEKPATPLPTLDLLESHPSAHPQITEHEIRETSARIEQELANFGVKATVEDVLVGPVVTRYEILPASGVKATKITNLDTDLARALIFKAIRITDVVPGKPYMGIETPNKFRETVWLRDVLDSHEFRHTKAILPMALGKDISGQPVVVDMAKMPHLLVAGQTGGGKSVGVNTMILSLLFKLTPEQVRFIMIDPKVVELSIYDGIPHLLTPVVTDMKQAENALRWAVEEMERRYQLVSYLQVRNIEGYNTRIEQAQAMNVPFKNPYWKPSDSMDMTAPDLEKLSYIVLIVDEFADLMMSAGKQVEEHIMRIAQKARAVGIHLILATQRPSTDVITGVIKANIPSRIAFTVASQIDSRTILDKGGAESLLGRGDMLYSGAGSPEIIRIHGAFMSDDEVQRVADNWRARGKPEYIESIVSSRDESETENTVERGSGELDPLFDEIVEYVSDTGVTSISGIQRRFSIGFTRAGRIIDQLEEQGILSSPDSRGKREVLSR